MKQFSSKTIENIGYYVYILLDPRDSKIFYVGKGKGNRVFAHVAGTLDNPADSDKMSLIKEIIDNNQEVELLIVRRGIEDEDIAFEIESTLIDLLSYQRFKTLSNITNSVAGHKAWERGIKTVEEIEVLYAAEKVNPEIAIDNVFIFSIHKALSDGKDNYLATRSAWSISKKESNNTPAFAVGLKNSISVGSYEISKWIQVKDTKRFEFKSPNHPNIDSYPPLQNKDWTNIIEKVKPYRQRGNYPIVEFNGRGQFKIKKGAQDKNTWHDCI